MARVIVLDAGVLIGHLDESDSHHSPIEVFLAETDELELLASVITIAECLVHPARAGRSSDAVTVLQSIGLVPVPVAASDAPELAEIRASTRLAMPDAVVVHTAEKLRAGLVTTDAALARAAHERGLEATLL